MFSWALAHLRQHSITVLFRALNHWYTYSLTLMVLSLIDSCDRTARKIDFSTAALFLLISFLNNTSFSQAAVFFHAAATISGVYFLVSSAPTSAPLNTNMLYNITTIHYSIHSYKGLPFNKCSNNFSTIMCSIMQRCCPFIVSNFYCIMVC